MVGFVCNQRLFLVSIHVQGDAFVITGEVRPWQLRRLVFLARLGRLGRNGCVILSWQVVKWLLPTTVLPPLLHVRDSIDRLVDEEEKNDEANE